MEKSISTKRALLSSKLPAELTVPTGSSPTLDHLRMRGLPANEQNYRLFNLLGLSPEDLSEDQLGYGAAPASKNLLAR